MMVSSGVVFMSCGLHAGWCTCRYDAVHVGWCICRYCGVHVVWCKVHYRKLNMVPMYIFQRVTAKRGGSRYGTRMSAD